MVVRPEQQAMQMLLTEAITTLCKNGLKYRSHFNVEGLLGITLDDEDVFLISIKDTVKDGEAGNKTASIKKTAGDPSPMSRAKQRKRRKRSSDSIERLTPPNIPLNNNNTEKKNSNVPYGDKAVDWNDVKAARENNKQEDYLDDSASSPGELIVVKEETLSEVERAQIENQCSQKEKSAHSGTAAEATSSTGKPQQSQPELKNNHNVSTAAIYASSNGQIDVPHRSPYQSAWESPFGRPNDGAQNGFIPEDRSFSQQTRGMPSGGDVTMDGDSLVVDGDGGDTGTLPTAAPTTSLSTTGGFTVGDYHPPPNTGSSSSRRKRKSAAVMRRGIPSTSPRSIPQVQANEPGGSDVAVDDVSMRYYCSICDKTFSRQFSWKVHMNVHRGIFPYTCSVCGKGFTSHINLKGHLVQHTNRREFKCAACGKEFIYKRGLNAHIPICKGTQNGEFVYEQAV